MSAPALRRLNPGTYDETCHNPDNAYEATAYFSDRPDERPTVEVTYYVHAYHDAPVPPETAEDWAEDSGYTRTPDGWADEHGHPACPSEGQAAAYEAAGYFYGVVCCIAEHTRDETGEVVDSSYTYEDCPETDEATEDGLAVLTGVCRRYATSITL